MAAFFCLDFPSLWPVFYPVSEHTIVNSPKPGTNGFPFPALVVARDFQEEHIAAKIGHPRQEKQVGLACFWHFGSFTDKKTGCNQNRNRVAQ
ncbi:MAG: hypothetical protein ABSF38_14725 [Verrucomicrobiota bacterium]